LSTSSVSLAAVYDCDGRCRGDDQDMDGDFGDGRIPLGGLSTILP